MKPKQKVQLDPEVKKLFTGVEVAVLLENIDDKLGVLSDGQKGLRRSHDKLVARVDGLTETVGELKVEVTQLTTDVSELKSGVARVEAKLDQKADRTEVERLDRRVALVEAK